MIVNSLSFSSNKFEIWHHGFEVQNEGCKTGPDISKSFISSYLPNLHLLKILFILFIPTTQILNNKYTESILHSTGYKTAYAAPTIQIVYTVRNSHFR